MGIDMIAEKISKHILDRTLVIVLAHPNDDNKTHILNECLRGITFPKLLCSNHVTTKETQDLCDWSLYIKENPILMYEDFGKYDMMLSRWHTNENGERVTLHHKFDNAYAVSDMIKKGLGFARYLKKDLIHIVNYDFTITDEIIFENTMELIDNELVVYTCPPHIFNNPACSSAFFSGKIKIMESFFDQWYNADGYYWYKHHGLFLEEKIYNFMKMISVKMKEYTLDDLGKRCPIGRHAIVADFVYDE